MNKTMVMNSCRAILADLYELDRKIANLGVELRGFEATEDSFLISQSHVLNTRKEINNITAVVDAMEAE